MLAWKHPWEGAVRVSLPSGRWVCGGTEVQAVLERGREIQVSVNSRERFDGTFQEKLKDVAGSPQLRRKGAQKGLVGGWDGEVEEDQGERGQREFKTNQNKTTASVPSITPCLCRTRSAAGGPGGSWRAGQVCNCCVPPSCSGRVPPLSASTSLVAATTVSRQPRSLPSCRK